MVCWKENLAMFTKVKEQCYQLYCRLGFDPDRVSRRTAMWAYRLFLDRSPESLSVVRDKASRLTTTRELRRELMASPEFKSNNTDFHFLHRNALL